MKIKLGITALVLGAALFAEAARAQSSVQIYGLLDAFVGYKKPMNGQSSVIAGNGGMTGRISAYVVWRISAAVQGSSSTLRATSISRTARWAARVFRMTACSRVTHTLA
jgi:hypothetical protein